MTGPAEALKLDRRAMLAGAILLAGGGLVGLPEAAFAEIVAASGRGRHFTPARFALLDELCALMIPATDTPGAREAGVPAFIDGLMTRWASDETRRQLDSLLDALDGDARAMAGAGFLALPGPARLDVLRAFDSARIAGGGAYLKLKELILTGYYLSEAGAMQELRYELAPGVWEAGIALDPDARAWAV